MPYTVLEVNIDEKKPDKEQLAVPSQLGPADENLGVGDVDLSHLTADVENKVRAALINQEPCVQATLVRS